MQLYKQFVHVQTRARTFVNAYMYISPVPIYLVSMFIGCSTAHDKRSYLCLCYKIDSASSRCRPREPHLELDRNDQALESQNRTATAVN